jgi:L-rhamnose mutarotase
VERVCFELRVRPDRLAEYRERHAAVRPEMLAALSAAGAPRRAMEQTDVNTRRQAATAPFFERALEFRRLEEVFHLD